MLPYCDNCVLYLPLQSKESSGYLCRPAKFGHHIKCMACVSKVYSQSKHATMSHIKQADDSKLCPEIFNYKFPWKHLLTIMLKSLWILSLCLPFLLFSYPYCEVMVPQFRTTQVWGHSWFRQNELRLIEDLTDENDVCTIRRPIYILI